MKKRPVRLVAVLLAMLMCLTLLPVTAMAEIAELPARVITALQSSEGLKTLFTAAEPDEKPSVQAGDEDSSVDNTTPPSWPQLKSFAITSNQVTVGAVSSAGLAKKPIDVSKIEITHLGSLTTENSKNIAGTVTIYVGEDFSVRKAIQVLKDDWSATVSDGATLVTATSKAITAQSTKNYIAAAALEISKDGTSVYYNVEFKSLVDSAPPKLSAGTDAATRSSHTDATVTFTSNEAGRYVYVIANADAEAPAVDTTGEGTAMVAGENTITLTELTEGAKKLYLLAKDESGNVTAEALVIDIPAYAEPTYSLYLSLTYAQYNAGWRFTGVNAAGQALAIPEGTTNTLNMSDLKAGQQVIVSLNIPDGTKELKSVSLITNDADKTSVPAQVTGYNSFTFTMPAANVRSAMGEWFVLKDTDQVRYTLSATVTKLWEDQAYQETNLKGYAIFTDENGAEITQALADDTVTVTATPRNTGGYYEFAFDQWKDESGITIKDEERTENTLTFQMPANDVSLFAEFKNVGTTVTWSSSPTGAPSVRVNGNTRDTTYVYRKNSKANVNISGDEGANWSDSWKFLRWEIMIDGVDRTNDPDFVDYSSYGGMPVVTLAGDNVTIRGIFEAKAFAAVTAKADPATMGSAAVSVNGSEAAASKLVFEGQTVTLTATPKSERYKLDETNPWTVTEDGSETPLPVTVSTADPNVATFTMPDTGKDITATAIFAVDPAKASDKKVLETVALYQPNGTTLVASGNRQGTTFTITLPANTDTSDLANMLLKLTVSEYATVKKSGDTDNWPAEGKACGMELDKAATFTVTAENNTTQDYTVTITKAKSSEKNITAAVLLNQTGDTTPLAVGTVSGDKIIFTLPSNTDKAVLNSIGMKYLKLTYPESATAKMVNSDGQDAYDDTTGPSKWRNGDVMCNMSLNTPVKFVITAEDGTTKTYTAEIKYTAPNAPTLSNGSAARSSKTAATVKFTTNEAGTYYYKVVTHGAAAPTADEIKKSTTKGTASAGETTITISNLTEDARDVYIVVVSASGGESTALKIEIPAYGGGTETPDTGKFTISVSAPKGGTITTNRTKADKGDEIIVTVTPDSGYQMVEGSLSYSLAVAGGETVKITNNRFTMPGGNVTITCQWETATTTAKGITSFSINGVAGAVNNTTNTITITMPRGTDVTKLTPVIATSGVKSLTPGSGETVNFTNSVTYTATMEDGSTKTYTVTVYVNKGTLADQFWDKLTDFVNQVPWWEYAKHQQSSSSYPKYW